LLDFDFIFEKAEALAGVKHDETEEEDGESVEDIANDIVGTPAHDADDGPPFQPPAKAPNPEPAKVAAAASAPVGAPETAKPGVRSRKQKQAEPEAPKVDPRYVVVRTEKDADGDEKSFAADGMELVACDNEQCSTILRMDEAKCRNCGAEYDVPEEYQQAAKPAAKPATATKPTGAAAEAAAKAKGNDGLGF
jgi:hypothetical protein